MRSQNIRTSASGQADNTTIVELLARRWRETRPYFTLNSETGKLGCKCRGKPAEYAEYVHVTPHTTVFLDDAGTECVVITRLVRNSTGRSDYDRSANFSTYHTFAVMQRQHRGILNPLVATRAEDDITQELQRRGYTLATDSANADFTVDFSIGSQDRININSYPTAYAGPLWGGPGWGSNLDVRQYREGTLAIDVFDARAHRPVWHGWAKKELSSKDIEQPAEPISKAVSAVLAKFPPA